MKAALLYLVGVLFLVNCETTPEMGTIGRIGDAEETPKWATGEQALIKDEGNWLFVHRVQRSGDYRKPRCLKEASIEARAEFLKYIQTTMAERGALEEGQGSEDPEFESVIGFFQKGKVSGAIVKQRFWEVKREPTNSGGTELRVYCAVQLEIEKENLEKQLRQAMKGAKSENKKKVMDTLDAIHKSAPEMKTL